ncbi:cell division protein FtsQ/DivIB [Alkalihalophilus marmarensis]|uniref:cell division protein FtsQ/DivIB n=1 Tax=Alkalihalophilus marmarensis TaxID=521377 RepID=UPI002DBE40CD|nr:FtsQ-type POTRA domain-containing protein [Alkalihalophilus marmarensis]MEC2073011.1 FtsQ-type POTRA domain-containing protein [Alkalihalophilus marmarensis]
MSNEKVVTINERIPSLKEQRKQRANRRLLFFLSLFFLLLLLMVYFQSPLSHIRTIEVEGNFLISDEQVIESSQLTTGTSMWNLDEEEMRNHLLIRPEIANVTISRKFPTTVVLNVHEHSRIGYLYSDGKYYPLLESGTFLSELPRHQFPADAPILIGWEQGEALTEFAQELINTPEQLIARMSEIFYSPTETESDEVIIHMNDGLEVHSTIKDFSSRMLPYPSIVRELDPSRKGILHMKMSPYFEDFDLEEEEDSEVESEG